MRFRYKEFPRHIKRPIIPIEVCFQNECWPCEVLVDSGADHCILDAQIAEVLGIDFRRGRKGKVVGITGVPEKIYFYPVRLKVGGWEYRTTIAFLEGLANYGHAGVVGQKGFFDKFVVKFDYLKGLVALRRRD